jgi:hypothetical protein
VGEDTAARTVDRRGGRTEVRELEATTRLNGYLDWPAVGQVCRVVRTVREHGAERREVSYGITSAGPEWADAEELLGWNRGHWGIENRLHYVRDVTMGEDGSRIRTGSAPQVMAGLRNAAVTLLRRLGATNIAEALRANAYRVAELLTNLGLVNL